MANTPVEDSVVAMVVLMEEHGVVQEKSILVSDSWQAESLDFSSAVCLPQSNYFLSLSFLILH